MTAFACNQRDEVRDLKGVAGALVAQPGMKQQTFVAIQDNSLTPWDTQQSRVFAPDGVAPTLAGADGGGGRNPAGLLFSAGVTAKGNGECFLTPEKHTSLTAGGGQAGQGYPCVLTAGFCAEASADARGVGYQGECSPTLKGAKGTAVICLCDQGGDRMDISEDVSGTLRAQMDGHPPLIYENHGVDSRYSGPLDVVPTIPARAGTGGNNLPLVADETYCIAGNIIGREDENGGNGFGCQADLSYTITATDKHAVYSRQRSDMLRPNDVTSTQSARQYKDATDLVCEPVVFGQSQYANYSEGCSTLRAQGGDHGGGSENLVTDTQRKSPNLIRRLLPLECERLMGYPDFWTDIPGASDTARYKALGNSVAIPCVEYVLRGIALMNNEE